MTKNKNKILKNAIYSILIASTLACAFTDTSQALEPEEIFKPIKKVFIKIKNGIGDLPDTISDTVEDLETKARRTFEEKEPKTFMDRVSQFVDHKLEDTEKVIQRNILRPLTRWLNLD